MARIMVDTRFGRIGIEEEDGAITRTLWGADPDGRPTPLLDEAARQLRAWDDGQKVRFDLPFRVVGSAFQQAVCAAIAVIPHGETRTYGDIARDLGQSAQAVGVACGANPIPILIPCHRVMGAGGRLVGFSAPGGVETKVALLRHEGAGGLLI